MSAWFGIPDIYWEGKKTNRAGRSVFSVEAGFLPGLIIEDMHSWLLLVQLPKPDKNIELTWLKYTGLLLAANNANYYGVLQRDNTWWLVRRYTASQSMEILQRSTSEHVALATVLGRRVQRQLVQSGIRGDAAISDKPLFHTTINGWV